MINIKEIIQYYPKNLHPFQRNLLREYLQYKILEIIFASPHAAKLSFLGGTALRIIHNNSRFSEDLDFDNFGLTEKNFNEISVSVKKGLELNGYNVEMRNIFKGAYRCNIKIPGLLFENNLSPVYNEKILIQLDTAAHGFKYKPDKNIINKFDVLTEIFVTPADIILSQKIFASLDRKRPKGRDFFDIIFLLGKTQPNYSYLARKLKIKNPKELKSYILAGCKKLDFEALAKDVSPFLFNPEDSKKILFFPKYIAKL